MKIWSQKKTSVQIVKMRFFFLLDVCLFVFITLSEESRFMGVDGKREKMSFTWDFFLQIVGIFRCMEEFFVEGCSRGILYLFSFLLGKKSIITYPNYGKIISSKGVLK